MVTAAPQQTAQEKQAAAVDAYATLHEQVYAPAFFHKLASDYGIRPDGDEEAYELMTMATKLRTAHDTEQQKQASAVVSSRKTFLKTAHQRLDALMQQHGLAKAAQTENTLQAEIKAAAATLTLDPKLAHAALSIQAASI